MRKSPSASPSAEDEKARKHEEPTEETLRQEVRRMWVALFHVINEETSETHVVTEAALIDDSRDAHIRIRGIENEFISHLIRIYPVRSDAIKGVVPGRDVYLANGHRKWPMRLGKISGPNVKLRKWLSERIQEWSADDKVA